MKEIIKTIKGSKRLLYISLLLLIVGFSVVLNYTFSAFTQSTIKSAADITVSELVYNTSVNGSNTNIISTPANVTTKSNIIIESENIYDTKYEITYEVCTDSSCNNVITKPNDFEVYYSSGSTDPVNGTVVAQGTKSIRLVIKNETNTNYYIKLGINSGYAHNALTLTGQISDEYTENDLIVKAIINGNPSNTFPTTSRYDATVECIQLDGRPISTTGSILWNTNKWELTVYNITENRTQCTVNFKTGTGTNAWYNAATNTLLYGIKSNYNSPQMAWTSSLNYDKTISTEKTISSTLQSQYITYADGYTLDPSTGKFNLTGVHTCIYSACYADLMGKYIVSNTVASNFSETNIGVSTNALTTLIQVINIGSNAFVTKEVAYWMEVNSTYQDYYWTYGTNATPTSTGSTTFQLSNKGTLKYNVSRNMLVGKYILRNTAADNSNQTNTMITELNTSNRPYKVITTGDNYLIYSHELEAVLASKGDDYGQSYYFRGAVENNYVSFAGMCWRIVRIDGQGNIKITLYNYNPNSVTNPCSKSEDGDTLAWARYDDTTNGQAGRSPWNDLTKNAAIGYMYGTAGSDNYNDEHANTNPSIVLTNLMTWYDLKLRTYNNKIADVVWFNDKKLMTGNGNPFSLSGTITNLGYNTEKTYYAGATRKNGSGTLTTTNSGTGTNYSRFTAGTTIDSNGNGALFINNKEYKIGLLTVDEVILAGNKYGIANFSNYLYKNTNRNLYVGYWLLTPAYYAGTYQSVMYVIARNNQLGIDAMNYGSIFAGGLRPCIALKSNTTISGGNGTQESPFVVN